ncbi:MAG: 50S ribosomal protein L24 [Nanoarchaeota archaeon]
MKQKFSNSWKNSRQTRKQRKYRRNAPLHLIGKMMATPLSEELRKKYGKKSIEIRKDDAVKVMRGSLKGKTGKITIVNRRNKKVQVENLQRKKKDGSAIGIWFDPSKLQITALYSDDKKRIGKRRVSSPPIQDNKTETLKLSKTGGENAPKKTRSAK